MQNLINRASGPAMVMLALLGSLTAQQSAAPKTPATSSAKAKTTATAKRPAPATATKPLVLKTPQEKFSYALGMNLGKNLHKESVPIDPNIVARGLKDGLAGGKTLLTDTEAQAAVVAVQ